MGWTFAEDDYQCHMIPLHLQEIVDDQPLAFGLDGYPVYGLAIENLDEAFGRHDQMVITDITQAPNHHIICHSLRVKLILSMMGLIHSPLKTQLSF